MIHSKRQIRSWGARGWRALPWCLAGTLLGLLACYVQQPAKNVGAHLARRSVSVPRGETSSSSARLKPIASLAPRGATQAEWLRGKIRLCQALGPAAPNPVGGVDCLNGNCGEQGWNAMGAISWQQYGQGEYVGHDRTWHVPEYRLRVDDHLEFVFRLTREETSQPYKLNVGDEIRIESIADPTLNRDQIIQPDGTITPRLLGQVHATRRTVSQLRDELEDLYTKYYKLPAITVSPLKVNTKLEDLRATVDSRFGFGGQARRAVVTPEGTIGLPMVGSVPAQGLTLDELKMELDARYAEKVEGMEVTPILVERAPRYVYVLGEVKAPGRFKLEGPTTVMQALSMGGGWNVGGNLRQVVVFRRADDWRLLATMLDLRGALYGRRPCPADEIWLNDSDVVVVPKSPILIVDNFVELVFTKGIYGIFPFQTVLSFTNLATIPGTSK